MKKRLLLIEIIFCLLPVTAPITYVCAEDNFNHANVYLDTENEFTKKQFYETGKKTYYIDENGRIAEGWQKIKGKYYYFNRSSGVMMRKCNVDGIKIGKSGAAKASKENIEKIKTMITARKIMLKVTSPFDTKKEKLKKCFK